jgi:hypothetical protein
MLLHHFTQFQAGNGTAIRGEGFLIGLNANQTSGEFGPYGQAGRRLRPVHLVHGVHAFIVPRHSIGTALSALLFSMPIALLPLFDRFDAGIGSEL